MCFSAEASFIAGATLTAVGVVSMKKAEPRANLAFAAIPFLFAIQQFSEGFEWLAFDGKISSGWLNPSMYVFILFAQIIWPAWVPFAVYRSEQDPMRLRLLVPLVISGFGLAAYHLYCAAVYDVSAEVRQHHILYRLEYLDYGKTITNIIYFATAVIPPFLSSNRRMTAVGCANLLSLLVTFFFFREFLLSVWCFFAALISASVLWSVWKSPQQQEMHRINSQA
jgi:hypothetical protein